VGFLIKEISQNNLRNSVQEVGFEAGYVEKVLPKYTFRLFKVFDLSPQQASILKQTALSVGCDCAVHREVITCKIDKTDAVLGGTVSQLCQIASKLKAQPFSLSKLSAELLFHIEAQLSPIALRGKVFDWSKTYLMGILNVTPDSFSDSGKYFSPEAAIAQAKELAKYSDIIDIGGESTRPFSQKVDSEEEIKRIVPIITSIREQGVELPISIDTRNAETARLALSAGADIVNDVSGGVWDSSMLDVVAEFQAPFILMHSLGAPDSMQQNPTYERVVDEVYLDLESKIKNAVQKGVAKEKIIVDIGIGFGKTQEHNIELLSRVSEFKSLGCPILVGVSRKSFITDAATIEEKDLATLAINSCLATRGVDILRVHNPQLHQKSIAFIDRL